MEDKWEGYAQKIEARLKELKTRLDDMMARAEEVDMEEARARLHQKMAVLKTNLDVARDRFHAMGEGRDEAWSDIKSGFEKAWDDLRTAFQSAASKLKKEGKEHGEA